MQQPITSSILLALAALAAVASFTSLRGLRQRREGASTSGATMAALAVLAAASAGLLGARWWRSGMLLEPLQAHVDGLLLIGLLLSLALLFLRWRPRMLAFSAFGLPVLTFIFLWAVCAAAWTYRPFRLDSLAPVWTGLHLAGVYVGTLCFVIAAVAAGAYLYVHRRIKHKDDPGTIGRLPPLESLERLIIRSATVGFAVLSIGLIAGAVVLNRDAQAIGPSGWRNAKLVLAGVSWVIYALLINLRFASTFRGPRAAWLSIAGLVLLLATYGLVTALPSAPQDDEPAQPATYPAPPSDGGEG